MSGKLGIIFLILLTHALAFLGFLGYGALTGRFASQQRGQYLATWQGEKLGPYKEPESVKEEKPTPQAAADKIASDRENREKLGLKLEQQLQMIKDNRFTVDQARAKLQKDIVQFQQQKQQFDLQLQKQNELALEEGFLKALKNYSGMSPKLVKADFMQMNDRDVVRYLAAMKSNVAIDILSKFKTPAEQARRVEIMRLLEKYNVVETSRAD